ncbi:oxygenase MpaB family protein [Salinimicrobium soli]|uniref:oxygenase MpaB family protein n=1 Tax=Salinimicrobium soli TaxID=1254399 RepID=UPI003AAE4E87
MRQMILDNEEVSFFVKKDSIVRQIWGKSDTVLFIFAGASAEFALNKAVDWLYFTGRLPSDPLGRLFSTVAYAGRIIYLDRTEALKAIDHITQIHRVVEQNRGADIPQWAYRDVLYMLIDYSVKAFELLERKLTDFEKEEIFEVFRKVGSRMEIKDLPESYSAWENQRELHLEQDLIRSRFTDDLYQQYRKHLGPVRYWLLKKVQEMECPDKVKSLLRLKKNHLIPIALSAYKVSRLIKVEGLIKSLLLPAAYKEQIKNLDRY